jgi:hypothetical protein
MRFQLAKVWLTNIGPLTVNDLRVGKSRRQTGYRTPDGLNRPAMFERNGVRYANLRRSPDD